MFNILNLLNLFKKNNEVRNNEVINNEVKNNNKEYIILNKEFKNNECIICLEKMIIGDKINILECGHIYHHTCIMEWFKRKRECPLCCK